MVNPQENNQETAIIEAVRNLLESEEFEALMANPDDKDLRRKVMEMLNIQGTVLENNPPAQNEIVDAIMQEAPERRADPEALDNIIRQKLQILVPPVMMAVIDTGEGTEEVTEMDQTGEEKKYNVAYTHEKPTKEKVPKKITMEFKQPKIIRKEITEEEEIIPEDTKFEIPSTPQEAKKHRKQKKQPMTQQQQAEEAQKDMAKQTQEQMQEQAEEQQKAMQMQKIAQQKEMAAKQAAQRARQKKKKSLLKNPLAITGASVGIAGAITAAPLTWGLFDIITS